MIKKWLPLLGRLMEETDMQEGKVAEAFFFLLYFYKFPKHPPKQPLHDLKYGDLVTGKEIRGKPPLSLSGKGLMSH